MVDGRLEGLVRLVLGMRRSFGGVVCAAPDLSDQQEIIMSKFARLVVLVTALSSLFAMLSSTAGAVTWHNTGGTSFHATGGPMTYSRASVSLTCSGSTATGAAPGGSTGAQHYNITGTL